MAQTSELKTIITADNKQFKTVVNDTIAQTKKVGASFNGLKTSIASSFIAISAAVGLGATAMRGVADDIDNITASAGKLKISAESFQFLEYAARRSDLAIGTLESGLQKLRLSLGKVSSNKGIQQALQELNLTSKDLRSLSIDEAYFKVADALGKVGDSAKQARLGTVLFGKSFQEQSQLINGDISELRRNFADLGGAANLGNFDQIDRAMDDLVTQSDMLRRNMFLAFGPAILSAGNALVSTVRQISNGISQGATATSDLFGGGYNPNALPSMQDYAAVIDARNNRRASQGAAQVPTAAITSAVDGLTKLAGAGDAAAAALNGVAKADIRSLLGLDKKQTGKDYLSSILTPTTQVEDPRFTELANQLKSNIESGSKGFGMNNETIIASLKSIAQENSYGLKPGETNSGMQAAVKELEAAAKNLNTQQKVVVELKYDQNGIITAFTSSSAFGTKAAEVVQNLASQEARATTLS